MANIKHPRDPGTVPLNADQLAANARLRASRYEQAAALAAKFNGVIRDPPSAVAPLTTNDVRRIVTQALRELIPTYCTVEQRRIVTQALRELIPTYCTVEQVIHAAFKSTEAWDPPTIGTAARAVFDEDPEVHAFAMTVADHRVDIDGWATTLNTAKFRETVRRMWYRDERGLATKIRRRVQDQWRILYQAGCLPSFFKDGCDYCFETETLPHACVCAACDEIIRELSYRQA